MPMSQQLAAETHAVGLLESDFAVQLDIGNVDTLTRALTAKCAIGSRGAPEGQAKGNAHRQADGGNLTDSPNSPTGGAPDQW
eukprot:scaffold163686_cov13-Prasinocladus_malaysianus.AAC.1